VYKVRVITLAQLAEVLRFHVPRAVRGQALVAVFVDVFEQFDSYATRLTALYTMQSAIINVLPTT
jgi:hypothetical protein